jgi:hypothetical protein
MPLRPIKHFLLVFSLYPFIPTFQQMRHISKCPSLHRTRDEEMKDRSTVGSAPPASVPAYTYFQNLVIQAAHFSYPEAFALPGGCRLFAPYCTLISSSLPQCKDRQVTADIPGLLEGLLSETSHARIFTKTFFSLARWWASRFSLILRYSRFN